MYLAETQQRGAQQGSLPQVKSLLCFFIGTVSRYGLFPSIVEIFEVSYWQRECQARENDLDRLTIHRGKNCSQRFMTTDDLVQTTLQGADVKRTFQRGGSRNVISGFPGIQLVEKPKALLSVG